MKNIFAKSFSSFLLLSSSFKNCQGIDWDYSEKGSNWPELSEDFKYCSQDLRKIQSPIDLSTEQITQIRSKNFVTNYENLKEQMVAWNGHSIVVEYDLDDVTQSSTHYFESQYGQDTYEIGTKFSGWSFEFHQMAEHTIDGQRYALEMQAIHNPADNDQARINRFFASALGIIFDTENYNKSISEQDIAKIDKFFDSLELDNPQSEKVDIAYADLMSVLDTANRWVYKGTLTTPPCMGYVYWNVLRQVLPIKEKHLALLQAKYTQQNYRATQELTKDHDLVLLVDHVPSAVWEILFYGIVATLFLCCLVGIFCLVACCGFCYGKSKTLDRFSRNRSTAADNEVTPVSNTIQ